MGLISSRPPFANFVLTVQPRGNVDNGTMGLALWFASGTLAFAIARFIPRGRPRRWLSELVAAWIAAFLLGVTATALDFGGWREPDPRAALACGFASFAIVGILRVATPRPSGEERP